MIVRKITVLMAMSLVYIQITTAYAAANCSSDRAILQLSTAAPAVEWNGVRITVSGWSYLRDTDADAPMGLGAFFTNGARVGAGRIELSSNAPGLSGKFRIKYGGFYASDTSFCRHHTINLVCMPVYYFRHDRSIEISCAVSMIESALANADSAELPD